MKRLEASDESLAVLAQNGDEEALEILLERYKPLARKLAQRYFIRGGDPDDVIQEAMIGLFKAVQSFDGAGVYPFAALAQKSCERSIIDAVRRADTEKNSFLNDSVPLDEQALADLFPEEEEMEATVEVLLAKWKEHLSEREFRILELRLQGLSYKEIALRLAVSPKSVDNALQRIRKKLQDF